MMSIVNALLYCVTVVEVKLTIIKDKVVILEIIDGTRKILVVRQI